MARHLSDTSGACGSSGFLGAASVRVASRWGGGDPGGKGEPVPRLGRAVF